MTHTGPNNVTRLTKQNTSYKMPWIQIYDTTVLDSWFVGDYSSASYHITVEFDSNQKETMQVLVVARPDHASYTVFGRTCIQDELITLTATVTASIMTLTANPSNPNFAGAKVIFNALYAETITPLALPTVVLPSSSGTAGMPVPSNLYGTFGTINVANQPSINAGYELDTLTLANGNGIGITSNSVTKTITVSSNVTVFSSIAVAGGNILTPASATDTLTLSGSNGVSITADTNSKTVNISVSLPAATTTTIGGVKVDNSTITINPLTGVISGAITYTLPTASNTELGGVKVDNSTITINPLTGVISGAITYTLPVSTSVILGGVKQGSNVTIAGDGTISVAAPYSLPVSTSVILGGVKQGSNVTIAGDGTISVAAPYSLPVSTSVILGGVKQGSNVTIAGDGTISVAAPYTLTAATTSALGGVIIPVVATSGITNTSGTIGLAVATNTQLGGVKIDNSTITINNGVISLSSSITTGLSIGTTLTIPTGDTSSRPTATQGNLRFNTSLGKFEGYYGSAWGAVGGGLSPTAVQTANGYIAKANDLVRCNTTSGAFSITLPSAPVDGDIIGVIDTHRKFALNNLIILAAGSKTIEDDTSLVLDIDGSYISLVYNDVNSNWRVLETPLGTGTSSTTIITSNGYIASVNDLVRCDTTTAAFSVTLPTSPNDGSIVNFVDVASAGSFFAHNLTVLPGSGNTVQNSSSLILNTNGTYVSLVYNQSSSNWKLLQVSQVSLPTASTTVLGAVKVDGSTITINGSGVISSVNNMTYIDCGSAASTYGGLGLSSINAGGAA